MSRRVLRLNQLIKEQLGQILLKEGNFPKECLVTITRVETSVDLKEAKILVSVLPKEKEKLVFHLLNKNIYHFQQKLNKILKLKRVPKIKFFPEKEVQKAARVEALLEKIKKTS